MTLPPTEVKIPRWKDFGTIPRTLLKHFSCVLIAVIGISIFNWIALSASGGELPMSCSVALLWTCTVSKVSFDKGARSRIGNFFRVLMGNLSHILLQAFQVTGCKVRSYTWGVWNVLNLTRYIDIWFSLWVWAVVAERSKAGDSSSLHLLMARVRTPPTVFLITLPLGEWRIRFCASNKQC